jgi:hypothetical protein
MFPDCTVSYSTVEFFLSCAARICAICSIGYAYCCRGAEVAACRMALLLMEVTEEEEGRAVRAHEGHTHVVGERNSDRANMLALEDERDIADMANESVMHERRGCPMIDLGPRLAFVEPVGMFQSS